MSRQAYLGAVDRHSSPIQADAPPPAGAIERFGIFEIAPATNANSYSNKFDYTVVELSLVFTGPGGVTRTVKGFHDGGTTWRCRFMPHLAGAWAYTCSWTGSGTHPAAPPSGGFTCADTSRYRGPLSVATDNPWYFQDARGAPFHARGFGSHHMIWWTASRNIITEAALLKTRITDYIAARGYNLTMISGLGHRTWQNGAGHTWGRAPESNYPMSWWGANSSSVHPSLDSFHPPAWAAYEDVLGHMRDAGIHALCFQALFDQWSKTGENPAGNLTAMTTTQEQRLARYYMARFGAYFNLFGLSPTWEWEDVFTTTAMNTLMNFIQSSDPYNRLLTVHDMSHSLFGSWIDFSLRQSDFAKAGTTGVARSLQGLQTPQAVGGSIRQSGVEQSTALVSGDGSGSGGIGNAFVNLPIVSGEDSWITTTAYNTLDAGWTMPRTAQQVVRCNWGIAMTGVITLADWWNGWQNTDPENDDHVFPPPNWDVGEAAYRWMLDFFQTAQGLSYRQHVSLNSLLSGGTGGNKSCFGIAGQEYVCYIDNGASISLNLTAAGTYDVTWYNPLSFASQTGSQVTGGGVRSLGASPFGSVDSVALVRLAAAAPTNYPSRVLALSPAHYWRLGLNTSDAITSGGITLNNVNGTPFGRPTLVTEDNGGGSAGLNGSATNSQRFVGTGAFNGIGGALTFSVALQVDAVGSCTVCDVHDTGTDVLGIYLESDGLGGMRPSVYRSSGAGTITRTGANGSIPVGVPFHLAIRFGSVGEFAVFVNGSAVTTTGGALPPSWQVFSVSTTMYLGSWVNGELPYNGLMAEVAVFASALSDAAILDLHGPTRKVAQVVHFENLAAGTLSGSGTINPAAQPTTHPETGLTVAGTMTGITLGGAVWNYTAQAAGPWSFSGTITKAGVTSSSRTVSGSWAAAPVTGDSISIPSLTAFLPNPVGTALPPSPRIYVYDTGLGNQSGSDATHAREIQSAINAATAGQNLVAIALTPGGTSYYNRVNGLTWALAANGTIGSKITLSARPGDTVVISRGEQFSGARTANSGFWEATAWDSSLKIYRSAAATYGPARSLSGQWIEFGVPHFMPKYEYGHTRIINGVPTFVVEPLVDISKPVGTSEMPTNYGGPGAVVHTDGRVYIRMQKPHAAKYSAGNKWPSDGRFFDAPGQEVVDGKLNFPVSENPNNYPIYLAETGGIGFTLSGRAHWRILDGINSHGYQKTIDPTGAASIDFGRGLHFCHRWSVQINSGSASNFTFNKTRFSIGSHRHLSFVEFKFGAQYWEGTSRGSFYETAGSSTLSNFHFFDCTLHGYFDFGVGGAPGGHRFIRCAIVDTVDDGIQHNPQTIGSVEFGWCYILFAGYDGPGAGSGGNNSGAWYIHHNIMDYRAIRVTDLNGTQPYPMSLTQHHSQNANRPGKIFNNTAITMTDTMDQQRIPFEHINRANSHPTIWHECFNNIMLVLNGTVGTATRYTNEGNFAGPSDGCMRGAFTTDKSKYTYNLYWRDPSLAPYSRGIVQLDGTYYNTIALAKAAKGLFEPNGEFSAKPTIPTIDSYPTNKYKYRPTVHSDITTSYTNQSTSPAGEIMAGWPALPSPYKGALDPSGSTMPIGPQNP